MFQAASTLHSWFDALQAELIGRGIDASKLMREAGMQAGEAAPRERVPLEKSVRFWQLAVAATGDEALGLSVARQVRQTTFHALGFAVLASETLEQALQRILRYFCIVSDAAELRLDDTREGLRFSVCTLNGPIQPACESVDALMAVLVDSLRALAGRDFTPANVRLARPEPANSQPFLARFGPQLSFAAERTSLTVRYDDARRPLRYGNEEIAKHNDEILQRALSEQVTDSTANRVRSLLIDQLSAGEPGQEQIAVQLHMSLRQLQRKLQQEETTFRAVLDATRQELAMKHIKQSRYSISEVAWLLGFADSSSFSRSFKRWTRKSPRDWRAENTPSTEA